MARKYHVFGGTNFIAAEKTPHENCWRVPFVEWNRVSAAGMLAASGLDRSFQERQFELADEAIAFVLHRIACRWFARHVERLGRVFPE